MKFQLVATVLLVGSMLVPSLAAPLRDHEEGKAKAVLQVIRMLLASENHGRGELQQAEIPALVSSLLVRCGRLCHFGRYLDLMIDKHLCHKIS